MYEAFVNKYRGCFAPPGDPRRRPQAVTRKLPAVIVVMLALSVLTASGQTLRIYHIDVEQASATLLVAPGGKTLLVDSGKNGHGQRIKDVMDRAGVSRIDFFVDTHYHEDHYGGIDDLVALGVPVLEAFDRADKVCCLTTKKKKEKTFKAYQSAVGEDAIRLQPGMTVPLDPAMTVQCISAAGKVIGETGSDTADNENDMSISLLVAFGPFRYFVGGDIEEPTELKIADADLVREVDVYVANHHGSHTSSSRQFMEDLEPRVVVISNGNVVKYKHPRKVTLDSYATLPGPPAVFQTNKYLQGPPGGNVADQFIADPETSDTDGTILVSADLAASSYTVSYGASTSFSFPFKGAAAPSADVIVIASLLPNPVGLDDDFEEVTLKNKGSAAVSLVGWKLRDRSGAIWTLDGTIAAGQSKTIRRNRMAMTLNNAGDDIALVDPTGAVRDSFSYPSSQEGVVIQTGH